MKKRSMISILLTFLVAVTGCFVSFANSSAPPILVYFYDNPASTSRTCLSEITELDPCGLEGDHPCERSIVQLGGSVRVIYANIDTITGECVDPYMHYDED